MSGAIRDWSPATFLRECRVERGLTQKQVAQYLGKRDGRWLSNIELGLCSWDNFALLCAVYGVDPEKALVEWKVREKKQPIPFKRNVRGPTRPSGRVIKLKPIRVRLPKEDKVSPQASTFLDFGELQIEMQEVDRTTVDAVSDFS